MLKPFPSWPLLIFYDTSNQIQSFQMVFKVFRFSSFSSFLGFLSQTEQIRETTTQTNSGFPLFCSSDWITVKYLYQLKIINQIISCLSQCVSLITLLVRNPANNKFLGLSTCSGLC